MLKLHKIERQDVVRSHRPWVVSGRHSRRLSSGVRVALAMLVAAVALYGIAPLAAAKPKPAGSTPGGGKQSAPKQAKAEAPKKDGAGTDAGGRVPPGQIEDDAQPSDRRGGRGA